ncbi:hypothetical protein CLV62_12510 [Dysgonomonas alginatilytica]|uniref:tRNA nuclease CdiA C-terminal domain-containing protein n=1 Tax=Dysgonomonas alginatilytica TaxID=1605892 RepID=A0A2V3PS43_9BACT|nr:hypothetical protein [Dysgonomonas alginatilytica]PXV61177.1 hypothetical protein CLV62_12510 [Dysgonomonas alginatilytica]
MEKDLQKVLKIISNAPDNFIGQLSKTEQEVYKKILGVVKDLDVDSSGNIRASIANLKKLNEIKTQLFKALLSKEYLSSVKEYVRQFSIVANLQNQSFDSKKPISKVVTNTAIDNTLETLTGKGYTETVVSKIRDVIRTSVTTGGSYKDLTLNLEKLIVGDEKQSLIKKQVQTPVVDALSIFSAEHTKLITADLNYEWFIYVGSNKTTTREFCEHLTDKKYVHTSEIPDIVNGLIDGHQCKLGKDGLPLGMFEDTTANNFQVNRGGYNCGHQLYPISKEQVPLQLRMRFEDNIGKYANKNEFDRLKKNPDYTNVEHNDNGGVKATHKDHSFHPTKGHYEKEVQDILYKNGDVIILENEKGEPGKKFSDGYLNGVKTDIKAVEGSGKNTIKRKFQEAQSQEAESVILYFPDKELFSMERISKGLAMFKGQSDYQFKEIVFIVDGKVYRY